MALTAATQLAATAPAAPFVNPEPNCPSPRARSIARHTDLMNDVEQRSVSSQVGGNTGGRASGKLCLLAWFGTGAFAKIFVSTN